MNTRETLSSPLATGRSFRLLGDAEAMPHVEELLRLQGYRFEPEPFSPFCRRLLHEPRPLGASLAALFGYIYIQDRSSMLPPLALAPTPGASPRPLAAVSRGGARLWVRTVMWSSSAGLTPPSAPRPLPWATR